MNSCPGLLYGGRFLKMTDSLVCLYFPFLPDFVIGECMFLGKTLLVFALLHSIFQGQIYHRPIRGSI